MYYHPRMFDWANGERAFAACQAVRKLGELVASHGDEMTRSVVELGAGLEKPRKKAASGSRAVRRRRVAA